MQATRTFGSALIALAAIGLASAAEAQEFPSSNVGQFLPSVTVLDQKLKNDAVSVTYAYLPQAGRLAILTGDPAKKSSASVLGSVDLGAGDHREVKVPLQSEPKAGMRMWAQVEQSKSDKPFANSDERAEQSFKAL